VSVFLHFWIPLFGFWGAPTSRPRDDRQDDLFRPALRDIINLHHPLVRLAEEIDWDFLGQRFSSVCRAGPGQPPLPTRLVAGLFILKHMHNLSDERLCGHSHPHRFRVWISGQVRRVTKPIRREMRRRAAVEPVIGHLKADHRMDRNYLKGRKGDRANAVLAAAGYNFSLLLRWLEELLRALLLLVVWRVAGLPRYYSAA
jgi:hypothetical protein